MQEEITQKLVSFTTKGAKITEDVLKKAIEKILEVIRTGTKVPKVGRNSLERLSGRDGGVQMLEISNRLPTFEKFAREYKIRYSIRKAHDPETGKTRWQIFFKSKQADALTAAFSKYTQSVTKTKHKSKPSLLGTLQKNVEAVRSMAAQDHEKNRGIGGKER